MRHFEKATKFLKISHKKWKCFFKILWSFKRTWTLQSCYILFQKKGIRKNYQPSLTENRMSSVWNNQQLRAKSISKKKSWNWPITLMPATVSQIFDHPYLKAGWTAVATINSVAQNQFPLVNHVLLNSLLVLKESRQQNCPQISFKFTGLAQHQDL